MSSKGGKTEQPGLGVAVDCVAEGVGVAVGEQVIGASGAERGWLALAWRSR